MCTNFPPPQTAANDLIAAKDDILRGARKTIDKPSKKLSTVRMPESIKQGEIFRLFVKENLIVPLRQNEACANPRVKELLAADFVAAEVGVDNVPNARYLWQSARDVMMKRGHLTKAFHPYVTESGKTKNIAAYRLSADMCVEAVIQELSLNAEEGEWLKKVTTFAGRVPSNQTLMDTYLECSHQ
jgi:hypothetical protein